MLTLYGVRTFMMCEFFGNLQKPEFQQNVHARVRSSLARVFGKQLDGSIEV